MNQTFSIGKAFRAAFDIMMNNKRDYATIIFLQITLFLILALSRKIDPCSQSECTQAAIILIQCVIALCIAALQLLFHVAIVRWCFALYNKQVITSKIIFTGVPHTLITLLIAGLIYGIMSTIGLLCLLIPGVIYMMRRYFYDLVIIDSSIGTFESFTISKKITKGHILKLMLFSFTTTLLNVITFTLAGPLITMSRIEVYRELRKEKGL